MIRRSFLVAASIAVALPANGQTRGEPQILLSVFGGLATGANLWQVDRQPLLILGTENLTIPAYDTLRLSRRLRSGFIVGINATYFPSTHLGVTGEISFLGLGLGDRCTLIAEDVGSDPFLRNRQICSDINGRSGAANTVGFFAGTILRASQGTVTPFARLQAGVTTRPSSLTEMSGRFVGTNGAAISRGIYLGRGGGLDPAAAVGVGLMAHLSPGYQFRLEVRDHLVRVQEVSGIATSANPGVPPTSARFEHSFALVVHLDIVLERKRGRRY